MQSVASLHSTFNYYNVLNWNFDELTENYSILLQESILTKQISNIKLNFSNFSNFLESNKEKTIPKIENVKNQLIKNKVDIKKLESISIRQANNSQVRIKGQQFNFGKTINSIIREFQQSDIFTGITKSVAILCVVFLINTYLYTLFLLFFSPTIAMVLTCVLVAPLVEESGKFVSIKEKSTLSYFIVFNFFEFSLWTVRLLNMGVGLPQIIIGRSLAVLLHALTTYIQKKGVNKGKLAEKSHFIQAVFIHGIWNFNAVRNLI